MTAIGARQAASRAQALLQLNRPAEALALINQAIASDPQDGANFCLLASAFSKLGRHQEARRAAERALSLDPESAWAQ